MGQHLWFLERKQRGLSKLKVMRISSLAHFLTLCPENFDIKSVSATYDNPADTTGSTLYADACVWDADA